PRPPPPPPPPPRPPNPGGPPPPLVPAVLRSRRRRPHRADPQRRARRPREPLGRRERARVGGHVRRLPARQGRKGLPRPRARGAVTPVDAPGPARCSALGRLGRREARPCAHRR